MRGVHPGDHVYFRTAKGPGSGEVKAVGKHGCTVHADGARHQVPWDRLLGHKLRVRPQVRVIEDGEDGAIVELPDGERRFVAGPIEENTDEERAAGLAKAIACGARVMFKAVPGTHIEQRVRKDGVVQGYHVGAADERGRSDQPGHDAATDTPEFRRWFGDSVVTDTGKPMSEGGKPLVVYHGTRHTFDAFKQSGKRGTRIHYFTDDPQAASEYAGEIRYGTPNVMPVYLSLQRPYEFDAAGEQWGSLPLDIFPQELARHFDERNILHGRSGMVPRIGFTDVIRAAEKAGYDGVIARSIRDGAGPYGEKNPARVSVAFRPEQIKSAIGNKGAFDNGDPDITKAQILFKADLKGRPGLALQQVTDRAGHTTRRWKRTQEDQPAGGGGRAAAEHEKRGAAAGYGTHNLEPGDRVLFEASGKRLDGKIVAAGKDGATVSDGQREHQVRWDEIRGHTRPDGGKSSQGGAPGGEDDGDPVSGGKIPPDKFSAADFYSQHNDPDATPEKIIAQFPADTAQKISAAQERLATIEQTIDQFKDGNAWQESRKRLHNEIVDRILSPAAIEGARPADGEAPTFVLLGGRGGSGKSKLAGKVYAKDRAIVLDADEIKGMLPEYEGWNAAQVHEESSFIFDHITDVAQGLRLNIVHDATMKTGHKAVALVKRFKDAGYRTEAHYMHLPRQEAAKRAVDRFLGKTQRFVPPEVVLGNTGNEASFDAVKRHVDAWSFHDNNVPMGAAPVLISAHGEPKLGLQKPDREGRGVAGLSGLPAGDAGAGPAGQRYSSGPHQEGARRGPLKKAFDRLRRALTFGRPAPASQGDDEPADAPSMRVLFRRAD